MPDGSIVSAIPISTDSLDAIYVPLTRTINGKPLSANVVLTADDLGIPDPLTYKGVIDCSTNPNYPAADAGALLLSSYGGSRGFVFKHASFNPNAALSYKIVKVID
jgi:hypothetical protein